MSLLQFIPKRWQVALLIVLWWAAAFIDMLLRFYGQFRGYEELFAAGGVFAALMAWAFAAGLLGLMTKRTSPHEPFMRVQVFWALVVYMLAALVVDVAMPWLFFALEWMRVDEIETFVMVLFGLILARIQLLLILDRPVALRFWNVLAPSAVLMAAALLFFSYRIETEALPFVPNVR